MFTLGTLLMLMIYLHNNIKSNEDIQLTAVLDLRFIKYEKLLFYFQAVNIIFFSVLLKLKFYII